MKAVVSRSLISGVVLAPPGKSLMQRACALALLNNGVTRIFNPGKSEDDLAAISIIQQLGAHVTREKDYMEVISNGQIKGPALLNCGESGLSCRMFAAIAAISAQEMIIEGRGSLLNRPMHFFEKFFPQSGIEVHMTNGRLPMRLKGPMKQQDISIDASGSSQYLTGLLFALSGIAEKRLHINVTNLVSKPYIDLSIQMLKDFGYWLTHEKYQRFVIEPADKKQKAISYTIEGDWSGAAFYMVAAAIAGTVSIKGLHYDSYQADKAILQVLKKAGIRYSESKDELVVFSADQINAFEFDATECPDMFPPLVVLALFAEGVSVIKGVSRLIDKESNRAEALKDVFTTLGGKISIDNDLMYISGKAELNGGEIDSFGDHRIAMAAAIAGLKSKSPVQINDAGVIAKSFPGFYQQLILLGAKVELINE